MKFESICSAIKDTEDPKIQEDNDKLHRELQHFVQFDSWRSPLIYGSLYISKIGSSTVLGFFARKTLEEIEKICKQRIKKDNKKFNGYQSADESEESQVYKKLLDHLLVSIAILVFLFDIQEQRNAIDGVERVIQNKLGNNQSRFIDKLPLGEYLNLLGHRFRQNEGTFQPLSIFFNELIKNTGLNEVPLSEHKVNKFKKYIELLIEESGSRIEKLDRIFSYAGSMDTVIHFAKSLFGSGEMKGKISFDAYIWDYRLSKSINNIRLFWVTCMTGLYAFAQSFDRFIALSKESEKVQGEAASIKTPEKDEPVISDENISRERIKKSKKSLFSSKNFKRKPKLKLAFACNKLI